MKVTKKTVFEVAGRDLEDFVQEHYGQEFNIAIDQESRSGSSRSFAVTGIVHDLDDIEKFKADGQRYSGGQWIAADLLNDLAAKGLIEKGEYVVNICW
jgi:hypothetical protein